MSEPVPMMLTTEEGEELPIVCLLDDDGDETDDLDDAAFAVCQTGDGRLLAFEITSCEEMTVH
ncbi:hypothetical protein SJ05684_c10680 [Sinorhizobium sojae CCBAU 05684]|uniref:Uncharacterized protein n=1 Tax=Sinorhizobium sojae CCBAU 05684 TaxID=716928 RepID=A0A249P9S2_9HYPH|nr:hypothetical protein [Sinorhizobium sojae]ASY62525.1 hypothetical protein SJ05684_c10680 [Sinorhizobium sojae CCBAU 05684]